MKQEIDPRLDAAFSRLGRPGMLIGYRFISAGDENALLPEEGPASLSSVVKVRRQSGTGRILARSLLARFGKSAAALPRGVSGAPVWPEGFVGSLAHDDEVAVAAVARSETMRSIGIDVEPRMPLPPELVDVVSTRRERMRYTHPILESRVLFCVKEAVFKALHPILGAFLDFHDIETDLGAGLARVGVDAMARVSFTDIPRCVAVAFVEFVQQDAGTPPT